MKLQDHEGRNTVFQLHFKGFKLSHRLVHLLTYVLINDLRFFTKGTTKNVYPSIM